MGLFGNKKKTYKLRKPTGTAEERQERIERNEAWKIFWKQMKENSDLKTAFVMKKMGIAPIDVDPVERQKNKLKESLYSEATKMISEDDELRREYAGNLVKKLIGRPPSTGRDDIDFLGGGLGSSLNQDHTSLH